MAPTPVVNFRLPLVLLERVDAARGAEPRTAFMVRALEREIDCTAPRCGVMWSSAAKAGVVPR